MFDRFAEKTVQSQKDCTVLWFKSISVELLILLPVLLMHQIQEI